jgi:hypothetical protein
MDINQQKEKIQQQMELLKKKMRTLQYAESEKLRKQRNEKLFTTGGIFDMINPDLTIRKNLKNNPYSLTDNVHYRRLVGLALSFDKIIKENNQERLQQLERLGADYLNKLGDENV